ncbi:MAG: hypothetical protein LLG09_02075 [Negativicutes bacterium]|nr:hypothetical protein [Negativicutes bacterium]
MKKNRNLRIGLAVLLLLAVGWSVYYFSQKPPEPETKAEPEKNFVPQLSLKITAELNGEVKEVKDYLILTTRWQDQVYAFDAYRTVFHKRFVTENNLPQVIAQDSKVNIQFLADLPQEVQLERDFYTFDILQPDAKPPLTDLSAEVKLSKEEKGSGGSASFQVAYGEYTFLYYTLHCLWQNQNELTIAIPMMANSMK